MDHVKCIQASQRVPFCISNIHFLNYNKFTHTLGDTHQARDISLITTTIIIIHIVYLFTDAITMVSSDDRNKKIYIKIINGSLFKCADDEKTCPQ